jgi:hypothetical protein
LTSDQPGFVRVARFSVLLAMAPFRRLKRLAVNEVSA